MIKEGKKRKLVINGVKLEDAGNITCKTNADEASAPRNVKRESLKANRKYILYRLFLQIHKVKSVCLKSCTDKSSSVKRKELNTLESLN